MALTRINAGSHAVGYIGQSLYHAHSPSWSRRVEWFGSRNHSVLPCDRRGAV